MPHLVSPVRSAGTLRSLSQPSITSHGLVLRPWRADDADAVRSAFRCPDIQRWHARRMDSREEALAWIEDWRTCWADERNASWAVTGWDDRPMGQVGLRAISLFEGAAYLSYWVLPEERGAEVAVDAASTLTRWTFDVLGFHRVALKHSTDNVKSCRVATKLGFPVEGTLRSALHYVDGWHDAHLHACLRTD
ncbi:GNAT family N-acetyltransferase [Lentzea sp. NPDC051838]|uniref:GNAT family N-acetyltransferase n=1 Tax=Lentzea sp. NPDC051838 TaxID=3154849 RepID=UPI00341C39CE